MMVVVRVILRVMMAPGVLTVMLTKDKRWKDRVGTFSLKQSPPLLSFLLE